MRQSQLSDPPKGIQPTSTTEGQPLTATDCQKQQLPNLKEACGDKYCVVFERGPDGKPVGKSTEFMQLKSSRGHVYPHSATHLGFASNKRYRAFNHVQELVLMQDGDDGRNFIFPIGCLDKLADVLQLHRRRKVSEATKERLRGIGFGGQNYLSPTKEARSGASESFKSKKGIGTPPNQFEAI